MTVAEFGIRPFAAGSLFGIRSFRVTRAGVLTGVHQQTAWTAGINEATCLRPQTFAQWQTSMRSSAASMAQIGWALEALNAQLTGRVLLKKRPKPPLVEPEPMPGHDTGALGCSCGFYAYFDLDTNPHHQHGNILGVIEGFGITTIGTRGFRCSKARVRALIVEDFEQGFALAKVMPNYPGVPAFPSVAAALAEYPLTPPPLERSASQSTTAMGAGSVTFTMTTSDEASRALQRLANQLHQPPAPSGETFRQRAMRLRRERNTGPTDRRGLDGHLRRKR